MEPGKTMRMDCEGYDGPISQEIFGHNWRVINNDLAASTAPTSGGNGSDMANNISLHHNLIHDVSKHGINIGDNMYDNLNVWNNVVYNVEYAAIRFNTNTLSGVKIFNNTFDNTNLAHHPSYGALTNEWDLPAGSLDIENNIFFVVSGTPYNSGSNGVSTSAGTIAHNLWFNGSGSTSFDAAPVLRDPKFVNAATANFHLQSSSPAIGAGSGAAASLVVNDYDASTLRTTGMDLGAYQYAVAPPRPRFLVPILELLLF